MTSNPVETVSEHLFKRIEIALKGAKNTRECRVLSDFDFIKFGLQRTFGNFTSGRDFVQNVIMLFCAKLSVSLFFKNLNSGRRGKLTEEMAENMRQTLDREILATEGGDPLAKYSELDDFAIYSTDGHTHSHGVHEKARQDKVYPVTHIYSVNLRTHTAKHDVLLTPAENKKKEHEIKALKRMELESLRMNEPKGVKVIHVYDPAVIDYHQWYKWKHGSSIYIITKEKSNSAFEMMGTPPWDRSNPINNGVLSNELVATSNGITIRRIRYQDPVSGVIYSFITNEMTLSPGMIAFLYFLRWNIEKMFDEFKNSLHERKAWSTTIEGKVQQANFLALAHNLMIALEHELKRDYDIVDKKVQIKKAATLVRDKARAKKAGRPFNCLIAACQRATKRSLQFVRWIANCIGLTTSWVQAIHVLRPLMLKYLQ